ncbi:MAG: hypothetical protein K9W42_13910 [Candidatus Heimdallarchaeota archaeon]|nr:hypothetical protein [Candidatus Heimdallarchaeota archaeon]
MEEETENDWEELTIESQIKPLRRKIIVTVLVLIIGGIVLIAISIPYYMNVFNVDIMSSVEFAIRLSIVGGALVFGGLGKLLANELLLRRKRKMHIDIPEFEEDEEIPELTDEVLDNHRPDLLEVKEERAKLEWDEE